MANVNFPSARVFNYQYDPVMICGSFEIDTAAIVPGTIHGDGLMPDLPLGVNPGLVYTAAGNYLVNLRHRFRHILSVVCQLRFEAGTPNVDLVMRTGVTVSGAAAVNTVQLCCTTIAGPALADPADDNRIDYIILVSNKLQDT